MERQETVTRNELRELHVGQTRIFNLNQANKVASLINDGFLKDHGQVMNYLRKKFQERTTPAVFVR